MKRVTIAGFLAGALSVGVVVFGIPTRGKAQGSTGLIPGVIRDSAGRGRPLAVNLVGATRAYYADSGGRYTVPGVRQGPVWLRVLSTAWSADVREVEVRAGDTVVVNFVVAPMNRGPRHVWLGCRAPDMPAAATCLEGRRIEVDNALWANLAVFGAGVIRDSVVWSRLWTRYRDTSAKAKGLSIPYVDWARDMVILITHAQHVDSGTRGTGYEGGINRILLTPGVIRVIIGPDSTLQDPCCYVGLAVRFAEARVVPAGRDPVTFELVSLPTSMTLPLVDWRSVANADQSPGH